MELNLNASWADEEAAEPHSEARRGRRRTPPRRDAAAPRRSALDRLGPTTGAPTGRGAPPHGERRERGGGGPDLGTEVDWRLSRVNLDDLEPKPALRSHGRAAEAAPRRVVATSQPARAHEETLIPSRLAGRLVLPGAAQLATSPPRAAAPPPPRASPASPAPPKASAAAAFVVHVGARGERSVVRASPPQPQPQQQPARPAAAAAVPAPRATAPPPGTSARAAPRPAWRFRDPKGAVQGPYSAGEIIAWYNAGYYGADLPLQRVGAETWQPLREALPDLKAAATAAVVAAAAAAAPRAAAKAAAGTKDVAKGKPATTETTTATAAAEEETAPSGSGWDDAATARARQLFDKAGTCWVYIDPAGARQGPFEGRDMLAWFQAGYLHDRTLLVADATEREPERDAFATLESMLQGPPPAASAAPAAPPVASGAGLASAAAAAPVAHRPAGGERVAAVLRADEAAQRVTLQLRVE